MSSLSLYASTPAIPAVKVAKFSLGNKFRNLGCILVAIAVFLVLAVSASVVLKEAYDQHPRKIASFHQALELQGKKLAREIAILIEGGEQDNSGLAVTAGLSDLLSNATASHNWLYAEINLHNDSLKYLGSPEENASTSTVKSGNASTTSNEKEAAVPLELLPLKTVVSFGNAAFLPVSDRERLAIWNTLLQLGPYRRSAMRNRHKILTVAKLVRKRVRKKLRVHGFILIQFDYSARKKSKLPLSK